MAAATGCAAPEDHLSNMVGEDADVTVTHRSELFLLLSHYSTSAKCFHRSYYESAVLEQIGCRQQQFVNATRRISCQHSSLILLEICTR